MGESKEQQQDAAATDSALASLVLLLSFLDRPADPRQLRHLLGKGSALLDADDLVIVEAMVLNRDIGFVREGQRAEVKLEAFPFTRYGIVTGVVERISRDAIENKELGLVFPCLVKLSRGDIAVGSTRVALAPGFAATAEIKTGRRRIIEYLLSPLSRRLQEAGRER